MELAARRLSEAYSVDGAPTAAVMDRNGNVFSRSYAGRTIFEPKPGAAFRVYDVNSLQRGTLDESWSDAYERDREREPLFTVDFDGVTYVWVYGTPPPDPTAGGVTRDVDIAVSDKAVLKAISVNGTELAPGDTLAIKLVWQTTGQFEAQYSVFNHLYDAEGMKVAQSDGPPLDEVRPMWLWGEGETVEDVYEMQLPMDLPAGAYTLALGMYDPFDGTRLPLYDANGERIRNDVFRHFTVSVTDQDG